MAKTSGDARRHIREWSNFFMEVGVVTNSLVDEFLSKYKKRKYLRQSLERMIARGLIVQKSDRLVPTKNGMLLFRGLSNLPTRPVKWDGNWFLISFDVPVNFNKKRDHLRRLLRQYYFYPLQKSVWICPNKLTEDFWELIVENDLDKYCKAMIVRVVEGDEDLKKYYHNLLR